MANNCGFTLIGELYSSNLAFKCHRKNHVTPIVPGKRLQNVIKCSHCRSDIRESHKMRMKEEEKVRQQYYTDMQEKMFQEAREKMKKDRGQRDIK